MELTRAEIEHIQEAVDTLREIYEEYPEIFTMERLNVLLIAEEIIHE